VSDAAAFKTVRSIVSAEKERLPVIVVSAMSGVTDQLLECATLIQRRDIHNAGRLLSEIFSRHSDVAAALLSHPETFLTLLESIDKEIGNLLQTVVSQSDQFPALQDQIVSHGELLSANLLTAVLCDAGLPATFVDARHCIITDETAGKAEPLYAETRASTRSQLKPLLERGQLPVLGGFVGATLDGRTTTLGRGGSDFTAALVAQALGSNELQIWTDVPGVLTADPRVVREARTIPRLSYAEAAELAYFGAKVLHPKTIQPAIEQSVPVRICNTRAPEGETTMVCADSEVWQQTVKAIAHKTGITLVQITSARMLGAHGFLHAIFEIFNRHRTVIDVVTTSEVSVSLSLDDAASLPALVTELERLGSVHIERERAIICVVGEGLRSTPGIAARVFGCLSDINISLISQGASRINLTFVIDGQQAEEAVSRLHDTFFVRESLPLKERARA
jgi:aspartate kinase